MVHSMRPTSMPSPAKPTPQQLAHLRALLVADMPDASWDKGAHIFSYRTYDKNDYLLRAGEICTHFYLVLKGVLRQFYTTVAGREFNKSFSIENEPCGAFHSALTKAPSRFAIQALEDCQLLCFRFDDLNVLFDSDPHWARLGRRAAEMQTLANEEREASFLLDSAPTRYQNFLQQYPDLEDRISHYHIASYLGITNVALSRIRKKLGRINKR